MIKIYYSPGTTDVSAWKEKLEQIFADHEFIEQPNAIIPRLADDQKEITGVADIDAYLTTQLEFQESWYEDRCDKYEFDPDANPLSNMIKATGNMKKTFIKN